MRKNVSVATISSAFFVVAPAAHSAAVFAGTGFDDFFASPQQVQIDPVKASLSSSENSGGLAFSATASSVEMNFSGNAEIIFHNSDGVAGTITSSASPPDDIRSGPRPPEGFLASTSTSGFADEVTVTSPGHTGAGYLSFSFAFNGSLSGAASTDIFESQAFGVVCASASGCTEGVPFQDAILGAIGGLAATDIDVSGNTVIGTIPFTYGTPTDFSAYLVTNAVLFDGGIGDVGSSAVDIFAGFGNVGVFSADGARDTVATIQSDTNSLHYVVALPEPATWAEILTGFAGVGLMLRRRHMLKVVR